MPIDGFLDGFNLGDIAHIPVSLEDATGVSGPEELAAMQAGCGEVLDSTSNGVSLAEKKARHLAHSRHEHVLGVIKIMLRNSVINKIWFMGFGFGISLLLPQPVLRFMAPGFIGLGIHLGMEGIETFHELRTEHHKLASHVKHSAGDVPDPAKVLDEPVQNKLTVEQIIKNARHADRKTTIEITAAVIGSIDDLPLFKQLTIMGIYGAGMTLGVCGMTMLLVQMEDWGQRLEDFQPRNPLSKLLVKTKIPARVGLALQKATPPIFHFLPWLGVTARCVTTGRVVGHGMASIEEIVKHATDIVERFHLASDIVKNSHLAKASHLTVGIAEWVDHTVNTLGVLPTKMLVWGITGVVVGVSAHAINHVAIEPLKNRVKQNPVAQAWGRASRSMLMGVVLELSKNSPVPVRERPVLPIVWRSPQAQRQPHKYAMRLANI